MAPGDAPDSRAQSVEASVHSEGHDDAAPEAEPVGHRDSAPQLITDIIAAPIPRLVAGDLDETALSAGVIRDAPETASSDGEPSAADGERADSEQDASSAAAITEEVLAIPTGEAYAPGAKSGESVESAAAGIDADVAAASDAPVSQPQKNDVNGTSRPPWWRLNTAILRLRSHSRKQSKRRGRREPSGTPNDSSRPCQRGATKSHQPRRKYQRRREVPGAPFSLRSWFLAALQLPLHSCPKATNSQCPRTEPPQRALGLSPPTQRRPTMRQHSRPHVFQIRLQQMTPTL